MPTIRNSGELEEWGEEELRNLAGFANFPPWPCLTAVPSGKDSLPTTRGKNPGAGICLLERLDHQAYPSVIHVETLGRG